MMPIETAKAFWQVQAGLIPGQPMAEYNKSWCYTSNNYETDGHVRGMIYKQYMQAARDYANDLEIGGLNWVTVSYVWL